MIGAAATTQAINSGRLTTAARCILQAASTYFSAYATPLDSPLVLQVAKASAAASHKTLDAAMKAVGRVLARRQLARGDISQIAKRHGCSAASLHGRVKAKATKQVCGTCVWCRCAVWAAAPGFQGIHQQHMHG